MHSRTIPGTRRRSGARPNLEGDPALLAAFFIAGSATVLVENARRLTAGEPPDDVVVDHRDRLERLLGGLRSGVSHS